MITKNDKNYSSITHLSCFAGIFFPLGNVIAPLVMWLAKKNESTFIDSHGKSAINFQLSLLLYEILLVILFVPITIITLGLGAIAIVLGIIPAFILIIASIISASINASNGEEFEYPFTINFLK